ncbi:hypothetical protein [Devosia rhizoryzae]|jgi:predicted adenine nucleotide alpha hydrolase (AANH) superfamily ATPase|uniref:Transposase n=1 Tax=Devosia rhizoryzae TaxID=2774137 RepID=A0ABX7C7M7_9HYPH|nr:hypothetical protein [Devosia rhizoryzae]QQR37961.1 hypothetical protein JI748_09095 [Devosia rhizoryzae]
MAETTKARPDWESIRAEYEGRHFQTKVICSRYGITLAQLRYQRERHHWKSNRTKPPDKGQLVTRMLRVLDQQVTKLEQAVDEPIDKQTATLATQVKTLDKLIELGASERNVEPVTRRNMADIRAKLVDRLAQSKR